MSRSPSITAEQLAAIESFEDLAQVLHDEYGWPVKEWQTFDQVADLYGIPVSDNVGSIGVVRDFDRDQSWGVFRVDFGKNKFGRSQLRAILNKVAESERSKQLDRQWQLENILFICRSEGSTWTFGHYTGDKLATAKLKTFGWSDPRAARTLLTRNLPLLRWESQAHWDRAWDAEALTREFYGEYRRIFQLFEQLTMHPTDGETKKLFVQSLFNRLLFLAFIEQMGWLKVEGSTDYLYTLFQRHKTSPSKDAPTFYHVLELLFFSGLSAINGVGGRDNLAAILGEVPYLNGGLFQRDPRIDVVGVAVPDSAFDEIFRDADGLFRRFTFTVTEGTPLDIDVAVDPEMLGKIFEELVTGRHESGSYYTPRSIVSFMCREALKGYLAGAGIASAKVSDLVDDHQATSLTHGELSDILNLLAQIKVVDPACGSGAYLLGMMRELYDLIQILELRRTEATPRELYRVKLDIIQNNLYGVDLDPFAVNIARLRLWLSLAVDHKGGHPEPLPNLDYKIEAGDSLTAPNPLSLLDGTTVGFIQPFIKDYVSGKADHFAGATAAIKARGLTQLKEARAEIQKALYIDKPAIIQKIAHQQAEALTLTSGQRNLKLREIELLSQSLERGKANPPKGGFDWLLEFTEAFVVESEDGTLRSRGFDVVLANPPYVRHEGILQSMGAEYKAALVSNYSETGSGTADLFVYFYDRGLQLLRPGGMFVYISSNKWFKAGYGAKLRRHIASTTTILSITDFGDLPVFESALAYAMIFVAKKQAPVSLTSAQDGGLRTSGTLFTQVKNLSDPYPDIHAVVENQGAILPPDAIQGENWTLADADTLRRLAIMRSRGIPLGEYVKGKIYYGIKTGFNEAFVIDGATRQRLIDEDPKSAEIIKPLAVGRDIRRWTIENKDRWLILTKIGVEISNYPAIFAHLSQYEPQLRKRADQGNHWWELRACAYYDEFETPKIVYPDMSQSARFAIAPSGMFVANTAYMICTDNLVLLGTLNSKPFNDQLGSLLNSNQGDTQRAFSDVFQRAILPDIERMTDRDIFEGIIIQVIKGKTREPEADVSGLEADIDARVEFLYFHQIGDETYDQWKLRLEAEATTEVGEVRRLLSEGESHTVEFKSSVIWDARQDKHSLVMRDEVLKEMCAFLNADGGTILCGVDDGGLLVGLERDIKHAGNKDKLGLVITNALGDLLRPNPVELIRQRFIEIDGHTILKISVSPDPKNRYESPSTRKEDQSKNLGRTHVRVEASARALEGQDLINWWNRRNATEISPRLDEFPYLEVNPHDLPWMTLNSVDVANDPQILRLQAEGWHLFLPTPAGVGGHLNNGSRYVIWKSPDGTLFRLCNHIPIDSGNVYMMRRKGPDE